MSVWLKFKESGCVICLVMAGKRLQAAAALRTVTRNSEFTMASDPESDIYSDSGPLSPEMGSWSPVKGITESQS